MTVIFSGSTGLNNKIDPVRLKFDPQSGVAELSEAINVEVDSSGRVSRQKGYSLLKSGDYYNMCPFDCGGYTIVMRGSWLYAIDTDGNETAIRSGMTPNVPIDYVMANDGLRNIVYYVNGFERGRVFEKVSYTWNVTTYNGPDIDEVHRDPPAAAHRICLYNGRIYLAVDNIIYGSVHHDFSKFIYSDNGMMFPGRITMMKPVIDGIYVSAGTETIFLAGQDMSPLGEWSSFSYRKVFNSYVVQGCHAYVEAQDIGVEGFGQGIICYTPEGICFAGPGGQFINLTKDKLSSRLGATYLPDGVHGSGIIIDNEKFLMTIEP